MLVLPITLYSSLRVAVLHPLGNIRLRLSNHYWLLRMSATYTVMWPDLWNLNMTLQHRLYRSMVLTIWVASAIIRLVSSLCAKKRVIYYMLSEQQ